MLPEEASISTSTSAATTTSSSNTARLVQLRGTLAHCPSGSYTCMQEDSMLDSDEPLHFLMSL